jgi:hypothetical protein
VLAEVIAAKAHCFVDNRGLYERAAREYATAPFAQFCAPAEVRWCAWTSKVFVNVNDDGRIEHGHKSFEVAARSAARNASTRHNLRPNRSERNRGQPRVDFLDGTPERLRLTQIS